MDVADLLVQPPASEYWASGLMVGSIVLFLATLIFTVSAITAGTTRKRVRRNVIAALAATLAVAGIFASDVVDGQYSPPNHNKVLETRLFETYGFTAPDTSWHRIERAGSEGLITTMKRDSDEFNVKVTLEGSKLSLVGTDGLEMPALNNDPEGSK